MKTADEISKHLQYFTGTEKYHRLGMSLFLLATDGVAWLAKNAECYWLTDAITAHQMEIYKKAHSKDEFKSLKDMQFWKLTKNKTGSGAKLICTDGNSSKPLITQQIPITDFPLDEIDIWISRSATQTGQSFWVMMLPSEY